MMLQDDIICLVLTYSIEPVYKLIPEIRNRIHKLPFGCFGTNPKNRYDILTYPKRYSIRQIIGNPHPKIEKHVMERINESIKNKSDFRYFYNELALVKTNNLEYIKWIEKTIFNYADRLCENNGFSGWIRSIINNITGETQFYINLLKVLMSKYRSKKFYDKIHNVVNDDMYMMKYGTYPFFLDISKEQNEQEFIRLLSSLEKYAPIPQIQRIDHPAIINELEIIYGLNSDKSVSSSEFIRKMMGPADPMCITMNPGAIHILKKNPRLINHYYASSNPKFMELVNCGLAHDLRYPIVRQKLEKENPLIISSIVDILNTSDYLFAWVGDKIFIQSERERKINQIDNVYDCAFYDPYKKKLINLVHAHLFYKYEYKTNS